MIKRGKEAEINFRKEAEINFRNAILLLIFVFTVGFSFRPFYGQRAEVKKTISISVDEATYAEILDAFYEAYPECRNPGLDAQGNPLPALTKEQCMRRYVLRYILDIWQAHRLKKTIQPVAEQKENELKLKRKNLEKENEEKP